MVDKYYVNQLSKEELIETNTRLNRRCQYLESTCSKYFNLLEGALNDLKTASSSIRYNARILSDSWRDEDKEAKRKVWSALGKLPSPPKHKRKYALYATSEEQADYILSMLYWSPLYWWNKLIDRIREEKSNNKDK